MLTTGGIIFERGQRGRFASCGFSELGFVRSGDEEFLIEIPTLTFKELQALQPPNTRQARLQ